MRRRSAGDARAERILKPTTHCAMTNYALSHLQQLEQESIHIIREVASEFERPVMLYSIGKDSGVMLRLAEKAFAPAKIPFKVLHVNTTWKFREMITFRDQLVKDLDLDFVEWINQEGVPAHSIEKLPGWRR